MAKKKASTGTDEAPRKDDAVGTVSSVPVPPRDLFAAPAEADLSYISPDLRSLAVRIDSLILDNANVKDHGDEDLPTHAESLREFGIRRAVVVRQSNRQIEAGNGSVMACKLNRWEYVPVIFEDDDNRRAKAFALADNAVGTLAGWNEENLKAAAEEAESLFDGDLLRKLTADIEADVQRMTDEAKEDELDQATEEQPSGPIQAGDIMISRRVIVTCKDEDDQTKLIAELKNRGYECRFLSTQVK